MGCYKLTYKPQMQVQRTCRTTPSGEAKSVQWWTVVDPLADHPDQIGMSPYSSFWNNPILYDDPDGQCPFCPWLDAVVDVGFVIYDVGVLVHEKVTTGSTSGGNWAALGADGASIAVPMAVGAGVAARASYKLVNKADDVVDVVKTANKAGDTKKTYQTYTKDPKNPADGVYSGKTSGKGTPEQNVANRDKKHHMNETHGKAKLDKSSTNSDAIRGREQNLIDGNNGAKKQGGTSGNTNRAVAEKNKNAQKYDKAAKKEFGN